MDTELKKRLAETVSRNLRKYRKQKRITQKDLGMQIGNENIYTAQLTISHLECSSKYSNAGSISLAHAIEICSLLNITMEEFLDGFTEYESVFRFPDSIESIAEKCRFLSDDALDKVRVYVDDLLKIPEYVKEPGGDKE